MKKIRILHVVGSMDRGGAESWIMNLLRSLDRDKYQFDFCCIRGQEGIFKDEIESLGGLIHVCPINPVIGFYSRFSQLLKDNKYDVVHSHVWLFSGLILTAAKRTNTAIRIAHSHNTQSKYQPSLSRSIYQYVMRKLIQISSTNCLACAEQAGKALFGNIWRKDKRFRVLYCSINVEFFGSSYERKTHKSDLGIEPDTFVVGNVGNLRGQKNHTFFLDVAKQFLERYPSTLFFIAGEGELRTELEEKARALGISENIIFAGIRGDVPALMTNVFDCFLFPSLYEGMPLTLVEAAAAGLRTVCSDSITEEATNVNPDLFETVSLSAPVSEWVDSLEKARAKPRLDQKTAYKVVNGSSFTNSFCLSELENVYGG